MNMKLAKCIIPLLFIIPIISFAQRGKDGNYTVSALDTTVNSYAYLTLNATAGTSTITVNNSSMLGGAFSSSLAQGDLLLIIQMQGATMDIDVTPATDWPGGNYTKPAAYLWDFEWMKSITKLAAWGAVTNYNNCGKFEQVEVRSVSGSNITLNCALQNSYTSSGRVQVVRVPRFNNLTLNTSASIMPPSWDGTTGGIVAIEVKGNLTLNASSKISASGAGFRGGSTTSPTTQSSTSSPGTCSAHANGTGNGSTQLGSSSIGEGGRKGESIGGYDAEYTALYSVYGRGSAANGGGGGGYQNCGGGGGSNIGSGTYTGKGVPSTTVANSVWNLESAGFAGSSSSGGGRGGYANSNSNQNATLIGPNSTAWCANASSSDARKENGGFGGHPLTYDATRLFMGGGGGAGDQDQEQGGSGGSGGGVVFLTVYGMISGSGTIEANGVDGGNSNPSNSLTALPLQLKGNDGAGGGGGGGAVFIRNSNSLPSTIILSAKGGNGGNQNLVLGPFASNEAAGPGGAGAGGNITMVSGSPTQNVNGGIAGTSNSSHLSEFTFNGATNGAAGVTGLTTTVYDIVPNNVSVCGGSSATLTVTVSGTSPGTLNWYTSQFGGSSFATGNSYTTPVLTATTTYYVGICPGTFRVPVTVTVNPQPTIAGTVNVVNPSCTNAGSISGLTVSGGTTPYQYTWNGVASATIDHTNLIAGTYTLTVTDAGGCTASSGPYTLTGTSGPIIDASAVNVQNVNCSGGLGYVTGITASGTGLNYAWNNSGGSELNAWNLSAGSYTLTVTDNNSCTSTAGPFNLGTDTGPSLNETNVVVTDATCGNNSGSITGIIASGSSLTYSWNGISSSSADTSNLPQGIYTLTVTDAGGCTVSSSQITVNAIAGPSINETAVSVSNVLCDGTLGSIVGLSDTGSGNTYSWTNGGGSTLNASNLLPGTYVLTITDNSGCAVSSSIYVIDAPIILTIDVSTILVQEEHCGQSDGSISGISVSGGTPTYSYQWNGSSSIGTDILNAAAGSYTLTVTDAQGCTASATASINALSAPIINSNTIVVVQPTCISGGSINGITVVAGGTYTYSWTNTAQSTLDLNNLSAGTYVLTVTDAFGCSSTAGPVTILAPENPVAAFDYLPQDPGINQEVSFDNASQNIVSSVWTLDSTTISSENISYTFENEGTYEVLLVVTDANGCIDSVMQVITITGDLQIPNVITDNSDGVNDIFEIQGLKENTSLVILNRWGQKVFETSNYANDWKGLDLTGEKLTEGVYSYFLQTAEGQKEHGFVHLIR
jgi:gliding motility-associated-like protein